MVPNHIPHVKYWRNKKHTQRPTSAECAHLLRSHDSGTDADDVEPTPVSAVNTTGEYVAATPSLFTDWDYNRRYAERGGDCRGYPASRSFSPPWMLEVAVVPCRDDELIHIRPVITHKRTLMVHLLMYAQAFMQQDNHDADQVDWQLHLTRRIISVELAETPTGQDWFIRMLKAGMYTHEAWVRRFASSFHPEVVYVEPEPAVEGSLCGRLGRLTFNNGTDNNSDGHRRFRCGTDSDTEEMRSFGMSWGDCRRRRLVARRRATWQGRGVVGITSEEEWAKELARASREDAWPRPSKLRRRATWQSVQHELLRTPAPMDATPPAVHHVPADDGTTDDGGKERRDPTLADLASGKIVLMGGADAAPGGAAPRGGGGGRDGNDRRKRAQREAATNRHRRNPGAKRQRTPAAPRPPRSDSSGSSSSDSESSGEENDMDTTPTPPHFTPDFGRRAESAPGDPISPDDPYLKLPQRSFVVVYTPGSQVVYLNTGSRTTSTFCTIRRVPHGLADVNTNCQVGDCVAPDGTIYTLVRQGDEVRGVHIARKGTIELLPRWTDEGGENGRVARAQGCMTIVSCPGYSRDGHMVGPREYVVLAPLYDELVSKLMKVTYTPDLERSAIGLKEKFFMERIGSQVQDDHIDIVDATVTAFLHVVVSQRFGVRLGGCGFPLKSEPPLNVPGDLLDMWITRGVPQQARRPFILQAVESHVSYELSPNAKFTNLKGGTVLYTPEVAKDPVAMALLPGDVQAAFQEALALGLPSMPVFTKRGVSNRDMTKWCGFRLVGAGVDMLPTVESTQSLLCALKRLVGKRDGETALLKNERLAHNTACEISPRYSKLASMLGKPGGVQAPMLGRVNLKAGDEGAYLRREALGAMTSLITTRCTYGTLRRVLERVKEVIHVANHELRTGSLLSVEDQRVWNDVLELPASPEQIRYACAAMVHKKREERLNMWRGIGVHLPDDVVVRMGLAKMKLEATKVGKVARIFVTYGDGWVAAPHVPVALKGVMDGWHFVRCGDMDVYIYMCLYPNQADLDRAGQFVVDAHGLRDTAAFIVHSDDFSGVINVDGVAYVFNGDVSSMDTSQKTLAHILLAMAYTGIDPDFGLTPICQAQAPIRVANPLEQNSSFVIHPNGKNGFTLGSGSINTTSENTFIVGLLCMAIAILFKKRGVSSVDSENDVIVKDAAAAFGYLVTVKSCYRSGELLWPLFEFLKMFYDPRNRAFVRMPTAYLRNLGTMYGAPDASRLSLTSGEYRQLDHAQRLHRFVGGVVNGLKHEPAHGIICALQERFSVHDDFSLHYSGVRGDQPLVESTERSLDGKLVDLAIIERYNLESSQYDNLISAIGNINLGEVAVVLTAFLREDYGCGGDVANDENWQNRDPGLRNAYM